MMAVATRGLVWMGVCLLMCGLSDVTAAPVRDVAADTAPDSGVVCGEVMGRLPATVDVEASVMSHVQAMLQRSAHFRRQCLALAARPWVYVRLQFSEAAELTRDFCAKSYIKRTSAGPLIAYVRIGRRTHWSEWIPHELEHVLETAEGMRTADFARGRGTWESAEDVYETTRAILAGRTVRNQMRRKPVTTND
jgi:hypothetical protein